MTAARHVEILKQSGPLSGQPALTIGALTSADAVTRHQAQFGVVKPWLWLILNEDNKVLCSDEHIHLADINFGDSPRLNGNSPRKKTDIFFPQLQTITKNLSLPYQDTVFVGYRRPFDRRDGEFPAFGRMRTVWIPASGFFQGQWQDGPFVVAEADGLISTFVPTGTSASLLLAPDGKKAIGREPAAAIALEGTRAQQIFRGYVAATQHALMPLLDGLDKNQPSICFTLTGQSLESMAQLATVKAALPRGFLIGVQWEETSEKKPVRIEPRFRRFCEHTGITTNSWSEPAAALGDMFHWSKPEWIEDLVEAINEHGAVIPT